MTAGEHLAKYGVSVAQAREFIVANLNSPTVIYNTAKQYGVTNQMLAEIYGGVTANDVRSFFNQLGFAAADLDGASATVAPTSATAATPAPAPTTSTTTDNAHSNMLRKIVSFNEETGILSTESIRQMVLSSGVSSEMYYRSFDLKKVIGGADGLNAEELGYISHLGSLTTAQEYESLRIGTWVNMLQSIDKTEMAEVENFFLNNIAAFENEDPEVLSQAKNILVSVLEDEAQSYDAFLTDEEIAYAVADEIRTFALEYSGIPNNSYQINFQLYFNFDY
jgi:hypothetical protein